MGESWKLATARELIEVTGTGSMAASPLAERGVTLLGG